MMNFADRQQQQQVQPAVVQWQTQTQPQSDPWRNPEVNHGFTQSPRSTAPVIPATFKMPRGDVPQLMIAHLGDGDASTAMTPGRQQPMAANGVVTAVAPTEQYIYANASPFVHVPSRVMTVGMFALTRFGSMKMRVELPRGAATTFAQGPAGAYKPACCRLTSSEDVPQQQIATNNLPQIDEKPNVSL